MRAAMTRTACKSLLLLILLALSAPALAHGDLESTTPAEDSTVKKAPRNVSIELSEAPAPDVLLVVKDGCGRKVSAGETVNGNEVTVGIDAGAQPGKWSARFRAISAEDGHLTQDSFGFKVKGKKDCSPPASETPEPTGSSAPPTPDGGPEDDSNAPVIPIALGAVIVTAAAFFIRRRAGGA